MKPIANPLYKHIREHWKIMLYQSVDIFDIYTWKEIDNNLWVPLNISVRDSIRNNLNPSQS